MEAVTRRTQPVQRIRSLIAPLLAVALAAPVGASEGGDNARAAALLDEGNKLFAARRYEAARARDEEAYAAYASPKILLNLAEAHRELAPSSPRSSVASASSATRRTRASRSTARWRTSASARSHCSSGASRSPAPRAPSRSTAELAGAVSDVPAELRAAGGGTVMLDPWRPIAA